MEDFFDNMSFSIHLKNQKQERFEEIKLSITSFYQKLLNVKEESFQYKDDGDINIDGETKAYIGFKKLDDGLFEIKIVIDDSDIHQYLKYLFTGNF